MRETRLYDWVVTRQDSSGEVMFFVATGNPRKETWSTSSLEGTRFTEDAADDLVRSLTGSARILKRLHVLYGKLPLPN